MLCGKTGCFDSIGIFFHSKSCDRHSFFHVLRSFSPSFHYLHTFFFSVIIIIWNCNSIFVFYSVRFSKWMFNETKITQLSADKHLHSYVWFRISSCELLFICLWFFRLMSVSSFLVVVAAFVFFVILFISWRAREINFSRRLCEWLKFKQKQWFFKINEKKAKSFE